LASKIYLLHRDKKNKIEGKGKREKPLSLYHVMGGKGVGAENQQLKIRRLLPISPKSKRLSSNFKKKKIFLSSSFDIQYVVLVTRQQKRVFSNFFVFDTFLSFQT
jgi:hypothetical protein